MLIALATMSSPVASAVAASPVALLPSLLNNVQVVGGAWMLSSVLFTTFSTTTYLKYAPPQDLGMPHKKSPIQRAALLTLLRFSGSLFLGLVAHPNLHVMARIRETWQLLPTFALPALFLFIANYSNSISLNRIGIPLTYTSKCAIPLITLILTVALDGVASLPSVPVLLTLIPIAIGIATASWNHPTFERLGFLAAMISCTSQSALNVSCKRAMNKMGVAGPVAQRTMVTVGLVFASAMALLQVSLQNDAKKSDDAQPPAWLAMMAATAYHVEYVLSFIFVKLVAPISYSACDAVRRLGIIISGHCMFGGPPFTTMNILGIALALAGALSYSILNH
jgi:hypothetical protein